MLFSNLLLSTAALVLGATATTVTHVKLETHTLTVHHSAATARPFGNSHSSKHFKQHHRVEAKKSKSHSKKVSKGTKSSKKGHQTLTKKSEKKCATTTHPSTKTASPSKKKKETSKASRKKVSSVASKKKHHSTATKKTPQAPTATKHKSTSTGKATTTKKATKTTSRASKSAVVSKTASQQPILIASPSSSLSQLAKDSLQAHNDLRAKHKVAALTWNNDLASAAQAWTDKCIYQHGQGKNIGAGENIAAYTGSDNVLGAISMWSDEVSQYNFNSPGYSDTTGHFTQQVWKATTEIGCAQTLCSSLTMPGKPSWSNAYYYVCEYKQGGNIVGSTAEDTAKIFSSNVFA